MEERAGCEPWTSAVVELHDVLQREYVLLRMAQERERLAALAAQWRARNALWRRRAELVARGVPHFWRTALYAHQALCALTCVDPVRDHEALGALQDVQADLLEPTGEGLHGFELRFVFGPNKHFANPVLTKKYWFRISSDPADSQASTYVCSEGFAAPCFAFRGLFCGCKKPPPHTAPRSSGRRASA